MASLGNRLRGGGSRSGRSTSLGQLETRLGEVEQLATEFGAPTPESEEPGFLFRAIDVLSGFNYAMAGATEELLKPGGSLGAATGRAARELYSSARSLPLGGLLPELSGAQKEGFGEVFEQMGVKTTTLGDVVPMLEGTFLGELVNTRGTAGLALDIFADPTTYFTFGASAAAKITGRKFGVAYLSKAGKELANRKTAEGLERAGLRNVRSLSAEQRKLADEIKENAFADVVGEAGANPGLVDHGGVKWAGFSLVKGETIKTNISEPVSAALNKIPGGLQVKKSVKAFADGVNKLIFSEDERIASLPEKMKTRGQTLARKHANGNALLKQRYFNRFYDSKWNDYIRANPTRQRAIIDAVDTGDLSGIRPGDELDAVNELRELFDEFGRVGVEAGILTDDQLIKDYFAHMYEGDAEQFSEVWSAVSGKFGRVTAKHEKPRQFISLREGERVSRILHGISVGLNERGVSVPVYPALKANEDILDIVTRYANWHVDALSRKALARDVVAEFGEDVAKVDHLSEILFDLSKPVPNVSADDMAQIDATLPSSIGGKTLRISEKTNLDRLSPEGRKEYLRRQFTNAKSDSEMVDALMKYDDYSSDFPRALVDLTGEAEEALTRGVWGEKARYVVRSGALWSDEAKPVFVPQALADVVEGVNTGVINSKPYKALKDGLRRFDFLNTWFKVGVFGLWPASLVRDSLTNVAFMSYRVGVHALSPGMYRDSIGVMVAGAKGQGRAARQIGKGGFSDVAGRFYDYREVWEEAAERGVLFTPAQVLTLDKDGRYAFQGNKFKRGVGKALEIRANVENTQRVAMFTQLLREGLSFDDAANEVARFLFDYNAINSFHREVLRRMFPFITFCVPTGVEALTRGGWKRHSEIAVGDEVASYNVETDELEWVPCEAINEFDYDADLAVIESDRHRMRCTPDHKWAIRRPAQTVKRDYGVYSYPDRRELLPTNKLRTGQQIIMTAKLARGGESSMSPADARLLGWLLTDGSWRWKGSSCEAVIYQSDSKFASEVAAVAGGGSSVTTTTCPQGKACSPVRQYRVPVARLASIKHLLKRSKKAKDDWCDVVCSLDLDAAEAMYDAMYKADGVTSPRRKQDSFASTNPGVKLTFRTLATLLGKRTSESERGSYVSHRRHLTTNRLKFSEERYSGKVWCPTTRNGTWVAKHEDGTISITGNTVKNIKLHAKELVRHPGMVASQLKPFRGDWEENEQLVKWEAEGLKLRVNRDGRTVQMLTGIDLPLRNLDQMWRGSPTATVRGMLGMLNPILKTPIEVGAGADFFTGRPLTRTESGGIGRALDRLSMPKGVKDWLGYRKEVDEAGRPHYTFDAVRFHLLFRSWAFSRLVSTTDRMFREYAQDETATRMMLDSLAGLRLKSLDLDEQRMRKVGNRIRALENSLTRRGVTKRFIRDYIPRNQEDAELL